MSSLNERQRQFCESFISCGNATAAAIRAGYSRKTAYSQGSRLMKNAEIRAYIQQLQAAAASDAIADAAEVRSIVSGILRDPERATSARLKAADLLLKASGTYTPEDQPLPNDEDRDTVQVILPWTGREDDLPNAIRWRNGVVTPLRSSEDEDEQPPAFGACVLQTLDPFDREQMEKLWKKMEGHTEHEAKTN